MCIGRSDEDEDDDDDNSNDNSNNNSNTYSNDDDDDDEVEDVNRNDSFDVDHTPSLDAEPLVQTESFGVRKPSWTQTVTSSLTAVGRETDHGSKRLRYDTSRDLSKESLLALKKPRALIFIFVIYSVCALLLVVMYELPGIVREDTKRPSLERRITAVPDCVWRQKCSVV